MKATIRTGDLVRHGILNLAAFDRWVAGPNQGSIQMKLWLIYVLEQWAANWWLKCQ